MDAGVALLAEGGWPSVTTRAVAQRGRANTGLIHYHFGGLPGLHRAVARRAGQMIIDPLVDALREADDVPTMIGMVGAAIEGGADEKTTRLAVELFAGAMRDPALGEVVGDELRGARHRLAEHLGRLRPRWPRERATGTAALILAVLDGLMLHLVLDQETPARAALAALEIGGDDARPQATLGA